MSDKRISLIKYFLALFIFLVVLTQLATGRQVHSIIYCWNSKTLIFLTIQFVLIIARPQGVVAAASTANAMDKAARNAAYAAYYRKYYANRQPMSYQRGGYRPQTWWRPGK